MLLVKTKIRPRETVGIGLFADEFISQGTTIWKFLEGFDLRLPKSILDELSPPAREQVLGYSHFDSATTLYELCSDDARFLNHSETPNTARTSQDVEVALQDIQPGEELTCDFRTFDAEWSFKLKQHKSPSPT